MAEKPSITWTRLEQRLWIITMFTGCATVYAARTAVPLSIVAIASEMKWDKKQSGSVLSGFYWGYTMTQVIGGYMSDRFGGDTVLALIGTGWSLLTFWTPVIIDHYPDQGSLLALIVLSRVLMGCLQGMHYPAISSLFSRNIPESDRAFSFATAITGSHFGTLISGSIGSYILYRFGWRCIFYSAGILGMVWVIFLRYYLMSRQRRKDDLILSLREENLKENGFSKREAVPWFRLFKSPALWAILLAHFGHAWGFNVLVNWLPTYFHETFPEAKGWIFNVVPWLLAIPTGFGAGWISDSLTSKGMAVTLVRKIINTIAMLGAAFFIFLVARTSDYHTALFLMAMALTCKAFHLSGICILPQDLAPKYSGSVYGIMNTAGSVTGFVGVYMAGHILETTKDWKLVFDQSVKMITAGWLVFTLFGTSNRIV